MMESPTITVEHILEYVFCPLALWHHYNTKMTPSEDAIQRLNMGRQVHWVADWASKSQPTMSGELSDTTSIYEAMEEMQIPDEEEVVEFDPRVPLFDRDLAVRGWAIRLDWDGSAWVPVFATWKAQDPSVNPLFPSQTVLVCSSISALRSAGFESERARFDIYDRDGGSKPAFEYYPDEGDMAWYKHKVHATRKSFEAQPYTGRVTRCKMCAWIGCHTRNKYTDRIEASGGYFIPEM